MPTFKAAYLIHGDDHGRIAERRANLRSMAEAESGANGVELFEGDAATPEAVAAALNAMTFALGRRFIVVDGVESWKERELEPLAAAMAAIAPDTTVAFFAREESRKKAPNGLHEAVRKAGGNISAEQSVKSWELPKWVIGQARELGLQLEPDAARALIPRASATASSGCCASSPEARVCRAGPGDRCWRSPTLQRSSAPCRRRARAAIPARAPARSPT